MCAIFGVFHAPKAAELVAIGLHSNQHRAIDYAGIVSSDGQNLYRECGPGLSRQVFTSEKLNRLHGQSAIGHIRYPTVSDNPTRDNTQPVMGIYNNVPIAMAHNGNITNTLELSRNFPDLKPATSLDTEFILRLLRAHSTGNIEEDIRSVSKLLQGSFTLGILLPDRLIAVRDKSGNRPLSIGEMNGGYCISSETCAFPAVGARHVADVAAGTIVTISSSGLATTQMTEACEKKCRFEIIYNSHPGSVVYGEGVARFRMRIGETLEKLFPVPGADIVTPVPDSSNFMAAGFAKSGRSGEYFQVIIRSHYAGRSFIAANQAKRDDEVAHKFTFVPEEIKGKVIVVIDDSIMRGTTLPKVVRELKLLGARAVHVRIGSPPNKYSCRYGIHTPTNEELVSSSLCSEEIRKLVGADSLEFLPLEALKSLSPNPETFCFACMNGEYW